MYIVKYKQQFTLPLCFIYFLNFRFIFMSMGGFWLPCMIVYHVYLLLVQARRGHQILELVTDSCEPPTMWVLGIIPGSSARIARAFNH